MVFLSLVREASPISGLPYPFSSDLMSSRFLSERRVPGPIYSLIIGLREGLWSRFVKCMALTFEYGMSP